ncbi:MAG: radical SAM protein [Polyangia bacterium]|jgi:7-carboxy-7-deazaguanine synthase|nr:radical SAM protein [Polyangia bacterium]
MRRTERSFEICEIFRSLQGETTMAGLPGRFLRLAGCNLRCRYCDTAYARDAGTVMSLEALVAAVGAGDDLVIVTGGEPLLQPGTPDLLRALCDLGRQVILETNGSLDILGLDPRVHRIVDVKCPGSGEAQSNRWDNLDDLHAGDEVKLVLTGREDFDYALEVASRHDLLGRVPVLLSPASGYLPPSTLAEWILASGLGLRLQLQLHRLIWPDRDRSV